MQMVARRDTCVNVFTDKCIQKSSTFNNTFQGNYKVNLLLFYVIGEKRIWDK